MTRSLLVAAMVLAACLPLSASQPPLTGSLTGRVTSQAGDPLPNTNVVLREVGQGRIADRDGWYRFDEVVPGKHTLEVRLIGYEGHSARVEIAAGEARVVDVVLAPEPGWEIGSIMELEPCEPDSHLVRMASNVELTAGLIRTMAGRGDDWALSPLGIVTCGAGLAEIADGRTLAELRKVFGPHAWTEWRSVRLAAPVRARNENALWARPSSPWLREREGSGPPAPGSALEITVRPLVPADVTAWFAKHTYGRLSGPFPELENPALEILVTSATMLEARWRTPFREERTHELPFHSDDGRTSNVPTMIGTLQAGYLERDGLQVLGLPLSDPRLVALFVLPPRGTALGGLLSSLETRDVRDWLEVSPRTVDVQLPRSSIRSHTNLEEPLRALGVRRAFHPEHAELGGRSGEGLHVDFFLQDVEVEIDENGLSAAAATRVGILREVSTGPAEPPAVFHADRPYLVVVCVPEEECVLFAAVVMDAQRP